MYERKVMVNVELLEMQESPKGLDLDEFPRDTEAVEVRPDGPSSWWGAYLVVDGKRYDYDPVAASRVGGHGGGNAAGDCGHIGTASDDPNDWRDCKAPCNICGTVGYWGVPHEFFFTAAPEAVPA